MKYHAALFALFHSSAHALAMSFEGSMDLLERSISGPPTEMFKRAPNPVANICGTNETYVFPSCQTDTDCQRPPSNKCRLEPNTDIPFLNALFRYGDGLCRPDKKSCKCGLNSDDDITAFCSEVVPKYVKNTIVVAGCLLPGAKFACDILCDRDGPGGCPDKPTQIPCLGTVYVPPSTGDPSSEPAPKCPGVQWPTTKGDNKGSKSGKQSSNKQPPK